MCIHITPLVLLITALDNTVGQSVLSKSSQPQGLAWLLCPWRSPGRNTGVGCRALLHALTAALQTRGAALTKQPGDPGEGPAG